MDLRAGALSMTVAIAGVALALAGCDSDSGQGTVEEPSSPATSTQSPTPVADPSSSVAGATCQRAELQQVTRLEWPLSLVSSHVLSAGDDTSAAASRRLTNNVARARERLESDCETPSATSQEFLTQAAKLADTPLDGRSLDKVLAAYAAWADSIGKGRPAEVLIKSRQQCLALAHRVRLGYAVWSKPTAAGKDIWVQLIVHNNTDEILGIALRGSLWAWHPDPAWSPKPDWKVHGGRLAEQFTWGGSSADDLSAKPHDRTTTFVGIGEFYKVHMASDGYFFDIRPEMSVGAPSIKNWPCSLPVVREH